MSNNRYTGDFEFDYDHIKCCHNIKQFTDCIHDFDFDKHTFCCKGAYLNRKTDEHCPFHNPCYQCKPCNDHNK